MGANMGSGGLCARNIGSAVLHVPPLGRFLSFPIPSGPGVFLVDGFGARDYNMGMYSRVWRSFASDFAITYFSSLPAPGLMARRIET